MELIQKKLLFRPCNEDAFLYAFEVVRRAAQGKIAFDEKFNEWMTAIPATDNDSTEVGERALPSIKNQAMLLAMREIEQMEQVPEQERMSLVLRLMILLDIVVRSAEKLRAEDLLVAEEDGTETPVPELIRAAARIYMRPVEGGHPLWLHPDDLIREARRAREQPTKDPEAVRFQAMLDLGAGAVSVETMNQAWEFCCKHSDTFEAFCKAAEKAAADLTAATALERLTLRFRLMALGEFLPVHWKALIEAGLIPDAAKFHFDPRLIEAAAQAPLELKDFPRVSFAADEFIAYARSLPQAIG